MDAASLDCVHHFHSYSSIANWSKQNEVYNKEIADTHSSHFSLESSELWLHFDKEAIAAMLHMQPRPNNSRPVAKLFFIIMFSINKITFSNYTMDLY